jgi:hypothetical protein
MSVDREPHEPTVGELALEIALRLPHDQNDARRVLELAGQLYDSFLHAGETSSAEVIALRRE